MTADLVARLLAHAEVHAQSSSPHDDEQAQWERDLREAASALRSSGEAVDYVPGELDRTAPKKVWLQIDTSGNNDERGEPWPGADYVTWQDESIGGLEIVYIRADIASPATPASAWRRKVEDLLRRLVTMQPPNVVLQQIKMLGEARDLLREAITPPTSTKGG